MKTNIEFTELTTEEQLACYSDISPCINYAKELGLPYMTKECFDQDKTGKALKSYHKLLLSLTGLLVRIAEKRGLNYEQINTYIANSQITLAKGLMRYRPERGTKFSSMMYLRLMGSCYSFMNKEYLNQNTVFSVSSDEESSPLNLEPSKPSSLFSLLHTLLTPDEFACLDFIFQISEDGKKRSFLSYLELNLKPTAGTIDSILLKLSLSPQMGNYERGIDE